MKKKYIFVGIVSYTLLIYLIISVLINKLTYDDFFPQKEKNSKIVFSQDLYSLSSDLINEYNIKVKFNPEKKSITAIQKTYYVNNTNETLNEIYFNVYPNAFRDSSTSPYTVNGFNSSYPNGFDEGYINFSNIKINDKDTNYKILKDKTLLHIPFKTPLKPKEKVEIYMEYEVKLPNANERFGYGKDTFNFGNWYPIVCVYDNGWNLDSYYNLGDPFFSTSSKYNITINAPSDFIIASSGNILSQEKDGSNIIWQIEGNLIRDFAWVASKDFNIKESYIDGIHIKMYFIDNNEKINNQAIKYAEDSLKTFNKIFGKYPYDQFSIVSSNLNGGMEYPNIVFINEKFYNDYYIERLGRVITHETAHQWWYSAIGNNQVEEAWLDEGLTTFSEYLFNKYFYNYEKSENYYNTYIKNYYYSRKNSLSNKEVILKSLNKFNSEVEYYSLAYKKGAMFLYEIQKQYGDEKLLEILSNYYSEFKYGSATTYDFINICEEVTKSDLSNLVNQWLFDE